MSLRDIFRRSARTTPSVAGDAKAGSLRYGVLTFSYANAGNFARSVKENGFFSANLGDYMQTLAARRLLRELGVPGDEIVSIDRDTISTYRGDPVAVLMTAVFFPWCFPISRDIIPIFVGFHASEGVIEKNLAYFRKHQPIGCRDHDTTELFRKHGVEAWTTGCVTMTFEPRQATPTEPKTFFVLGSGAGAFPAEVIKTMPEDLLRTVEFVFQREIRHGHPLTADEMREAEGYAAHLLAEYRARATLIVTPLHHATTPCISSGIPVVVCRQAPNTRFSYLTDFMDIHTPGTFERIDWSAPKLPDIAARRAAFIEAAQAGMTAASAG